MLTGINLGLFRDREAGTVCRASCGRRARFRGWRGSALSSIEVNHVDDDLVAALRETPTVGRHLRPLQSGDDAVLRAMRRRYTVERFSISSSRSPTST